MPQDEIADRPAVVLYRLRLRPLCHAAASPILALDGEREVAECLQIEVGVIVRKVRLVRIVLDLELQKPGFGADMQLLDEPAHSVGRESTSHSLHQYRPFTCTGPP